MSDRLKICRQVASLFALSTSPVAGEAAAARSKANELAAKHGLTFADVSPHCNEVAMKVARAFWSIPEARPATYYGGIDFGEAPDFSAAMGMSVEDLRRIFAGLRDNPFEERVYGPFGTPPFRPGPVPPRTYAVVSGDRRCVEDINDTVLRMLLSQCEHYRGRIAGYRAEAHDALDDDNLDLVEQLLERIRAVPRPQPPETETALRAEMRRRGISIR